MRVVALLGGFSLRTHSNLRECAGGTGWRVLHSWRRDVDPWIPPHDLLAAAQRNDASQDLSLTLHSVIYYMCSRQGGSRVV